MIDVVKLDKNFGVAKLSFIMVKLGNLHATLRE